MSEPDRTALTYRLELRKAVAQGVLEAGGATFLLLIALRWFGAGATAKALVASGGSMGLLLSPVVVSTVARLGWPAARGAMALALSGGVLFLVTALWDWLPLYVFGAMVGMACATAAVPLMTQIYQENYPARRRGKLYSRTVMVRIAAVAGFSELGGRLLSADISRFRWILIAFAAALFYGASCLARMPSRPLADDGGSHPFRAMRFLRSDRVFRHVLICWMLMGFANLMMLPMRVEYLANERYGLSLDVQMVALLTGVIPSVARLVMSQLWGWLFDRVDFLALRIFLNIGFAAAILTFFLSDSLTGLVLGAVIFGASNSGGDVAWGLWVTKFAPPAQTADYMSVHTFLTGVRGVLAPLVAFHFAHQASISSLGWLAAGLIGAASLLLVPEAWRRQQTGADRPALPADGR
ncbi:MAG: MFS transporter [Verrucomicrobiales bacterium]|nr:MFS transporter [Verrucomicrobiales bacterium]